MTNPDESDDIIDALTKSLEAAGFKVQSTKISLEDLFKGFGPCDCADCRLKRALQTDPSLN